MDSRQCLLCFDFGFDSGLVVVGADAVAEGGGGRRFDIALYLLQ